MIFTQVDMVTGEILGLETQRVMNSEDNWLPTSVEAYQLMCLNNGQYIINMPEVAKYAQTFEKLTVDTPLILPEHLIITKSLPKAKQAKKHKNKMYKNLFIEAGVKFGDDVFPFTIEDRINYIEQFNSRNNIRYFVKNRDGDNVIFERKDFEALYESQVRNVRYYEVYTDELNKFIDTVDSYEDLQKINYEYNLPDEYKQRIEDELKLTYIKIANLDFTVNDELEAIEIAEEVDNIETTNEILENLKENLEHPESVEVKKIPKSVKKDMRRQRRNRN